MCFLCFYLAGNYNVQAPQTTENASWSFKTSVQRVPFPLILFLAAVFLTRELLPKDLLSLSLLMPCLTALSVCKLTFFLVVLFFIQRHLGFGSLIKKAYFDLNYPQFPKMPPTPRLKIILSSPDWEFQQHLSLKINVLFVVECFPYTTLSVINICTSVCLFDLLHAAKSHNFFFS